MHKDHGTCEECQICGKKEARTVCTFVMDNEGNKETDCWCVCEECAEKIKGGVHDYYKELLAEGKGKKENPQ